MTQQLAPLPGLDNHGKPRQAYAEFIAGLSFLALAEEISNKLWLSAFAANNPRSDYHWQVTALFAECQRRGEPELYDRVYLELEQELFSHE